MKKLTKQIIFDACLYSLLAAATIGSQVWAENLVSFVMISLVVLELLVLFLSKESIQEAIRKRNKGNVSKLHRYWCRISTCVGIALLASLGWYWVAAFWVIGFILHFRLSVEYDEIFGKPTKWI